MIGRKTRGGLVITSSALWPEFVVTTSGKVLGLADGLADGEAAGDGDAGEEGVGVGGPCSVKLAHGLGGTLAHSLCRPGLSPGNGLTVVVKLPLPSALTLVATWLGVSQ